MNIRLTKYQRQTIAMLKDGWYISLFENHSTGKNRIALTNGNDELGFKSSSLKSLTDKGLLNMEQVYSTVSPGPETDTYNFTLK